LMLEFDDGVERYQTQPISLLYLSANDRQARYTPDFLVRSAGGFHFEEVKPEVYTNCTKFRGLHQLHRMHIQQRCESTLHLVTDRDIRVGHTIPNLHLLYHFRRVATPNWSRQKLRANLGAAPLFGDLKDFVARQSLSDTIPFALLFKRRYLFDVTQKLTTETRLEISK